MRLVPAMMSALYASISTTPAAASRRGYGHALSRIWGGGSGSRNISTSLGWWRIVGQFRNRTRGSALHRHLGLEHSRPARDAFVSWPSVRWDEFRLVEAEGDDPFASAGGAGQSEPCRAVSTQCDAQARRCRTICVSASAQCWGGAIHGTVVLRMGASCDSPRPPQLSAGPRAVAVLTFERDFGLSRLHEVVAPHAPQRSFRALAEIKKRRGVAQW